jgi:hypothetical protein
MEGLRATHPEFRYLQEKYHIPGDFCMPAELFREEQLDYSIVYYKRCCSVYDFYKLLSEDNPCFVDRQSRRANKESHAVPSETNKSVRHEPIKSLRHEHPAAQDNSMRREQPQASVPTRTEPERGSTPQVMSAKRNVNPAYNPFIHASAQPQRQDAITFKSTNPSDLNWEQRDSAEKAEVRRSAPKKNAPIPSDGDETNTDGETSSLFEDKLLPAQKSQILRLKTAIKRIKSKTYSPGYLKNKERAINHAEFERLAGLIGPCYLAGVKFPWTPDHGHAPIHYDDYQVDMLKSRIDKIKNCNAAMCQLEYTANKGGPGGQARR